MKQKKYYVKVTIVIPVQPAINDIPINTIPFTTVFFPPLSSQPVAHFIAPTIAKTTPRAKQIAIRKATALEKILMKLSGSSLSLSKKLFKSSIIN